MLAGLLTEEQADQLALAEPDALRLMLLAANARIAELQRSAVSPSTPSAAVPAYLKPTTDRRRRKTPGAKPGQRRPTP